jgi:glycosyltransferase involved in cell wall biosynthesis
LIRLAILGTRGIPARYGGFETFAEQLSTRLAARGVNVTVFCPSPLPKSDESYRGVRLRFVRFPSLGKYSEMFWDARCFCAAWRHFDVVYMLGLGGAFAAWVPRFFGAAVWINTDGIEWKRTKFTWPQRWYLALAEALSVLFANRIIADSAAIASYLRKRYYGLRRVSTIAYGADVPTEEPDRKLICQWGLEPGRYYLAVCRLEPENHLLEIVDGFEASSSPLPLVIVGNVENPNSYVRALLGKRGSRIIFLGTVFDREKLTALRFYAKAYMHGHSVGGTNPSLLEAMACSNLIIAHDNPFNREVLGDIGLYFQTATELKSLVEAVEEGDIKIRDLRKAASDRVREHYLWDQIADAYLQLLPRTEA